MHMPTQPPMPFMQYGQRGYGMLGDLVTYASWGAVALCAAEVYYIFQHERDLLGGFGLIHDQKDAISLLKFYGVVGVVAFSIATLRWIKITAAGLGVAALAGMYGTDFHIKAEKNFDAASLPKVANHSVLDKPSSDSSTVINPKQDIKPLKPVSDDVAKNEIVTTRFSSEEMANFAVSRGYTKDRALTKGGREWCLAINPNTGYPNKNNDEHSIINCTTKYSWEPPAK